MQPHPPLPPPAPAVDPSAPLPYSFASFMDDFQGWGVAGESAGGASGENGAADRDDEGGPTDDEGAGGFGFFFAADGRAEDGICGGGQDADGAQDAAAAEDFNFDFASFFLQTDLPGRGDETEETVMGAEKEKEEHFASVHEPPSPQGRQPTQQINTDAAPGKRALPAAHNTAPPHRQQGASPLLPRGATSQPRGKGTEVTPLTTVKRSSLSTPLNAMSLSAALAASATDAGSAPAALHAFVAPSFPAAPSAQEGLTGDASEEREGELGIMREDEEGEAEQHRGLSGSDVGECQRSTPLRNEEAEADAAGENADNHTASTEEKNVATGAEGAGSHQEGSTTAAVAPLPSAVAAAKRGTRPMAAPTPNNRATRRSVAISEPQCTPHGILPTAHPPTLPPTQQSAKLVPAAAAAAVHLARPQHATSEASPARTRSTNGTMVTAPAAAAAAAAAPSRTVLAELVKDAQRVCNRATEVEAAAAAATSPSRGEKRERSDGVSVRMGKDGAGASDAVFFAEAAQLLRESSRLSEEVAQSAASFQTQTGDLLRMLGPHAGLASLLGEKYTATPLVHLMPLLMDQLEALLASEEDEEEPQGDDAVTPFQKDQRLPSVCGTATTTP